jgi:hypothetical protein
VVAAQPVILAVLNPDSSVNSYQNPAPAGALITFLVSGADVPNPGLPEGTVAPSPAPAPVLVDFAYDLPSFLVPIIGQQSITPAYAAGVPGVVIGRAGFGSRSVSSHFYVHGRLRWGAPCPRQFRFTPSRYSEGNRFAAAAHSGSSLTFQSAPRGPFLSTQFKKYGHGHVRSFCCWDHPPASDKSSRASTWLSHLQRESR